MKALMIMLLGVSALAQNPVTSPFPGALDDDSSLTVAKNNVATTLSSGINASTTTLPVTSTAGFLVGNVVTFGMEKALVTAVGSGTLTIAERSAAFGGATPTTHTAQTSVSVFIEGYAFNAVAAAIKALETSLGINLANVEKPLTFTGPLVRTTNAITLPMWGTGTRPVAAGAIGNPGDCVQWSTAGVTTTGTPCGSGGGGTGANALGYYLVNRATNAPANAVNLGVLTPGLLKISIASGVATPSIAVAADIAAIHPMMTGDCSTTVGGTTISCSSINGVGINLGGTFTTLGGSSLQFSLAGPTNVSLPQTGTMMAGNNNLSEITIPSAARATLGLGSIATYASTAFQPALPWTTGGDTTYYNGATAVRLPQPGNGTWCIAFTGGVKTYANCPSGFTNPMTTAGDLIVGGSGGAAQRLAATAGYLHWNGFSYAFDTPSGGGGGGGGGASQTYSLLDWQVTRASGSQLVFGANCAPTTPCNVEIGGIVQQVTTGPYSVTVANAHSGSIWIYFSNAGTLSVGVPTTLAGDISVSGVALVSGVNAQPADAKIIARWDVASGVYNTSGYQFASYFGFQPNPIGGSGIDITNGPRPTISIHNLGTANGTATLGANGLVPASQLPTGNGGTGITDHALLTHLDYASSGHLGFEASANKSTDNTLGGGSPSATLYPSQSAVKPYIDTAIATRVPTSQLGVNSGVATLDSTGKLTAAQLPSVAGGTQGYQAFAVSGTYTVPSTVSRVFVQVWGGGAGGYAGNFQGGNGGSGGGFSEQWCPVTPSGTVTVTVGAGGAAGTTGAGGSGGDSSFGSCVSGTGATWGASDHNQPGRAGGYWNGFYWRDDGNQYAYAAVDSINPGRILYPDRKDQGGVGSTYTASGGGIGRAGHPAFGGGGGAGSGGSSAGVATAQTTGGMSAFAGAGGMGAGIPYSTAPCTAGGIPAGGGGGGSWDTVVQVATSGCAGGRGEVRVYW